MRLIEAYRNFTFNCMIRLRLMWFLLASWLFLNFICEVLK